MTIALAGDTMLGRGVAARLADSPPERLVDEPVAALMRAADLTVLNLECCISERGEPWPDPRKPFFFRAPPAAVEVLAHVGADAVTLANNHALDFGEQALLDTLDHLDDAGIGRVGAGPDVGSARLPLVASAGGVRVAVVGVTDHPRAYAAGERRGGVCFADLQSGVPGWLVDVVSSVDADITLVTPHWGPNMTSEPPGHVRRAADALHRAGATLVAGHSAHVFHGARLRTDHAGATLYDLGDFLDDYAVDPVRRNDLGLLWLATVEGDAVTDVQAIPLRLHLARTVMAEGADRAWIVARLAAASAPFGTVVEDVGDRLLLQPGRG